LIVPEKPARAGVSCSPSWSQRGLDQIASCTGWLDTIVLCTEQALHKFFSVRSMAAVALLAIALALLGPMGSDAFIRVRNSSVTDIPQVRKSCWALR
jgi:hypothetical protein